MRITIKQLKELIRESVEETMEEMHMGMGEEGKHHPHMEEKGMEEEGEHHPHHAEEDMGEEGKHHPHMEEMMKEAVAAAYRAGLRKGRSSSR
jgi:hypothetical protein